MITFYKGAAETILVFSNEDSEYTDKQISKIASILTYTDKAIEYNNKFRNWGYTDPTKIVYERGLNRIKFPSGLFPRVYDCFKAEDKLRSKVEEEVPNILVDREVSEYLRDYQREVVDTALRKRRLIIQSPTGSGKSIMLCEILSFLGEAKVLIVVPGVDLLKQLSKIVEDKLGKKCGRLGGGKNTREQITVAVINSAVNEVKKNPNAFMDIQAWLVDECHKAGDNQYLLISNALKNAHYRYGFSATARREKGDDLCMYGMLSSEVITLEESSLAQQGYIASPTYYCVKIPDRKLIYKGYSKKFKKYLTPNGKPDRAEVYEDEVVHNEYRNECIASIVEQYIKNGSDLPFLILVERVVHGEIIKKELAKRGIDVPYLHGNIPSDVREQTCNLLREKKLIGVVASKILNEATDVPSLGLGIIASGGSSKTRLIQQIGRFVRPYGDKKTPKIIDFKDLEGHYLYNNYVSRRAAAEKTFPKSVKEVELNELMKIL